MAWVLCGGRKPSILGLTCTIGVYSACMTLAMALRPHAHLQTLSKCCICQYQLNQSITNFLLVQLVMGMHVHLGTLQLCWRCQDMLLIPVELSVAYKQLHYSLLRCDICMWQDAKSLPEQVTCNRVDSSPMTVMQSELLPAQLQRTAAAALVRKRSRTPRCNRMCCNASGFHAVPLCSPSHGHHSCGCWGSYRRRSRD